MTAEDENPDAMLQKIFTLAQKYSKMSENRLLVKCKTSEGGLIFAFNTENAAGKPKAPIARTKPTTAAAPVVRASPPETVKTTTFPKTPRIFSESEASSASESVASSATETSDEFYMFEESETENEDLRSMRDRVRALCLQRARQDLFMPDLKNIPWQRLIAPGWPAGLPMVLDHPSPSMEQFIDLKRRLEAGEIQFFWK